MLDDDESTTLSRTATLIKWCFLAYIAVLPMSGTIALRNLLLVVLMFAVVMNMVAERRFGRLSLIREIALTPWPLLLWVLYLFAFPLLAVQPGAAWQNLKGQWIESILAWLAGYGAVRLLGRKGPDLWLLGMASAFPLMLHLALCLAAWLGLFGNDYFTLDTLEAFWHALVNQARSGFDAVGRPRDFPLGFRGVEPMHGNLGYAASQAIVLFGISSFLAWREHHQKRMYMATLAIVVCFASILIARSRGAILFSILMLLALVFVRHFKWPRMQARISETRLSVPKLAAVGVVALCLLALLAYQSVRHDSRWQSMRDKVQAGLLLEDPVDVLCNGLSATVESDIRSRLQGHSPDYVGDVLEGLKGQDGGRILLMRAGMQLVLDHPRGLDGSRQSYQKLMEEKCGHVPRLHFAHSHQSWIDLSLALGWIGALLFAAVLIYFMRDGWLNISNPGVEGWATAMFLVCFFWSIRGMVDSVYREHYLQMQAVLTAYAYWRIKLVKRCDERIQNV